MSRAPNFHSLRATKLFITFKTYSWTPNSKDYLLLHPQTHTDIQTTAWIGNLQQNKMLNEQKKKQKLPFNDLSLTQIDQEKINLHMEHSN